MLYNAEVCRSAVWEQFATSPAWQQSIKAKFHYADQIADLVADLVSDLAFDKFVRVCDQLATVLGRKQVADRSDTSDLNSIMEFGLY